MDGLTYQKILAGNTMVYIFSAICFPRLPGACRSVRKLVVAPRHHPDCSDDSVFRHRRGWLLNGDNNVFTQISLIVLVGLACKNAILIVEFAREKQLQEGMNRVDAVLEACRLRLRPILMTSLAFTMGVIPLVLSTGSGIRNAPRHWSCSIFRDGLASPAFAWC